MSGSSTRYQILFDDDTPTENFTAAQKAKFEARVKALKAKGVKIQTWDTQNNALSKTIGLGPWGGG